MIKHKSNEPIDQSALDSMGKNGHRLSQVALTEAGGFEYTLIPAHRESQQTFTYRCFEHEDCGAIPVGSMPESGYSIAATLFYEDKIYVYWIA